MRVCVFTCSNLDKHAGFSYGQPEEVQEGIWISKSYIIRAQQSLSNDDHSCYHFHHIYFLQNRLYIVELYFSKLGCEYYYAFD